MNPLHTLSRYLLGVSLLAAVATLGLSVWVSMLASEIGKLKDHQRQPSNSTPALGVGFSPGLGEFMTAMQLHMGKIWFAGKSRNWDLARYELDELRETVDAAQGLYATKNGVDVSKLLAALTEGEISRLGDAVEKKNQSDFTRTYDEALSACNGCHEASGHRFIKITRPSAPPVTNQKWDLAG